MTNSLLKKLCLITITILALQSCAFHSGTMSGNAAISDANFTVIGLATGTTSTTHVIGFGGLGKEAMVLEAKRNMYNTYPLKPGQALANVSVDFKRGHYILFSKTTCTISADIIDFNNAPTKSDFDDFNAEISGSMVKSQDGFSVGEKVLYTNASSSNPKFREAVISSIINNQSILRIENSNGSMFHIEASLANLYKNTNDSSLHELDPIYRIGDSVYFESKDVFKTVIGIITAIGGVRVAVEYENKNQLVDKNRIRTEKTYLMEQYKKALHGHWTLTTINKKPVAKNNQTPTLSIDARGLSVTGFGGCNNYFGSFTMEEKGILIGSISSTRKACNNNNIEADFFKAFGNQVFKIKKYGSTLTLEGTSNTLVFRLI